MRTTSVLKALPHFRNTHTHTHTIPGTLQSFKITAADELISRKKGEQIGTNVV